ncbi:hypothetical protein BUALT_Bualt18G0019300 [Buddleja alternifolia]|uniref:non-specific serine/threonine protein kinase n=1 Tax=Buddleja alternifolia TaxID=168488 RepID=A0AAV6W313_9LAMI|nr:hypothetical protein BUALT_Bualt18G0019300 [Buddleja alternifolia]
MFLTDCHSALTWAFMIVEEVVSWKSFWFCVSGEVIVEEQIIMYDVVFAHNSFLPNTPALSEWLLPVARTPATCGLKMDTTQRHPDYPSIVAIFSCLQESEFLLAAGGGVYSSQYSASCLILFCPGPGLAWPTVARFVFCSVVALAFTIVINMLARGEQLDWQARLNVIMGVAKGLAYPLHDCCPQIIHRDIKSSNILLDGNFDARVSDFGLAKLLADEESHITTFVAGTFVYLAPEYMQSGRATGKTDVYSFGVLVLEIVSGKWPTDASFIEKGFNIVGWVCLFLLSMLNVSGLGTSKFGKCNLGYVGIFASA